MDQEHFLYKFEKASAKIDRNLLDREQLKVFVGIAMNSVVLKIYKAEWSNDKADPVNASSRIFFAVWVNVETLKYNKIFYNIHALKLRKLTGYNLSGRAFAAMFRNEFIDLANNWVNVSVAFGPLTLMEGWEYFENENIEKIIVKLGNNFAKIAYLIDDALEKFRSTRII